MNPQVNINVAGPAKSTNYTYKTVVLVNNLSFEDQVTQPMAKYVVKWNFDLQGHSINLPENIIIEFDGGTLKRGTLNCKNVTFVSLLPMGSVLFNCQLTGNYVFDDNTTNGTKEYHPDDASGLGRIILRRKNNYIYRPWLSVRVNGQVYLMYYDKHTNKLYGIYNQSQQKGLILLNNLVTETSNYNVEDLPAEVNEQFLSYSQDGDVFTVTLPGGETITSTELNQTRVYRYEDGRTLVYNTLSQVDFSKSNTIYVIQYDFELSEEISIPANCVLEFDGGSISGDNINLNGGEIAASDNVYIFKGCNITNYSNIAIPIAWFGVFPSSQNQTSLINDVIVSLDDFKVLQFGYGTYVVNIRVWRSNITIEGKGIGSTIIKCPNGSNFNVFDVANDADFSDFSTLTAKHHICVRDLEIDGNRNNIPECTKDTFGHGLIATMAQESSFYNLYIHDCRMTGIDIVISSNRTCINNILIKDIASDLSYPSFDVNACDSLSIDNVIIFGSTEKNTRGFRLLAGHYCICNVVINECNFIALEVSCNYGTTCNNNIINATLCNCKYGLSINGDKQGDRIGYVYSNVINMSISNSGQIGNTPALINIGTYAIHNVINATTSYNKGNLCDCYGKYNNITINSFNDGADSTYSDYKWAVVAREGAENNTFDIDIETSVLHGVNASNALNNRILFSYKNDGHPSTEFPGQETNTFINKDIPAIVTALPTINVPIGTKVVISSNGFTVPLTHIGSKWVTGEGRYWGELRGTTPPTLTESQLGYMFFDTKDGASRPIWWKGLYWVDAVGTRVTWPITFTLTNVTASYKAQPFVNKSYTTVLRAATGYSLPASITIIMGSTTLTSGTDYTYDQSTGTVVILGTGGSGGVTSVITITASGVANS